MSGWAPPEHQSETSCWHFLCPWLSGPKIEPESRRDKVDQGPNRRERVFTERDCLIPPKSSPDSRHSRDTLATSSSGGHMDFQLGNGIKVKVTKEDIQDVQADVVVIGNDGALSNNAEAAQSILCAGGENYAKSLRIAERSLRDGDSVVLRCDAAPGMRCEKVYHALFDAPYGGRSPQDWRDFLEELYSKACTMAMQDDAFTVAVVLLGAGKAGGPTGISVRAALEAFSRLPDPGCLGQLLLVERDERRSREAVLECQNWTSEHRGRRH